jgi:hypothetical protein
MSSDKYFVIGIGGTGMRCIEAFTHLCAIGMFDNKEIDVLSIDTDTNNGKKGRSEQLIDRYIRIKGGPQGKPTANSFFTAKLNLYKFAPEYTGNRLTYELISGLNSGSEEVKRDNKALSDLLFDKDVQQFQLDHGYRAQTHLGSHLMYHCIVEAAKNVRDGRARKEDRELSEFIDKVYQAGEHARVFILGSIFGGTGASSIPIIPKALQDGLRIKDKNAELDPNAKFACSLLTDYFNFNVPDGAQRKEQKLIADSNNFSRNSQAALMFYEDDQTVKLKYKLMYHVGWPRRANYSQGDSSARTITGGGEQRNPAHITELLCAAAAHDFFARTDGLDQREIVYKSADFQNDSFLFEFQDFFGADMAKEFMNRLGAFLAFAHIIINREKGGEGQNGAENLAKKFKEFGTPDYINLPLNDAKDIDEFVKSFAFSYDTGRVLPGWLFQVRQSVDGPFLFHTDAFSLNPKQLREFHFGKLFADETHQFARKGKLGFGSGDPYETFLNAILKDVSVKPSAEKQKVERLNERFLAHTYNTLTKLFNILKG